MSARARITKLRQGGRKPCAGAGKAAAPEGYRRLLRWAALPITDRRWAAPLSAVALGFGLFVGVAIGPGAAGTFATGAAQIIEIPGFAANADDGEEEGEGTSSSIASAGGKEEPSPAGESESAAFAPIFSPEGGEEASEATTPAPTHQTSPAAEQPEPRGEALAGVVLHVNPAAGSYTLVEPGGALDAVHAAKAPQPGTKLSVPTRLLANGTFAEAGTRVRSGTRARASFGGIVTYVDPTPAAPVYTVSKRGASVLVHVHPDPSGAAPVLPALGAFATVAVDIEEVSPIASTSASPPVPGEEPAPPLPPPGEPAPPAPVPPLEPPAAPAPPAESPPAPAPPSCAPDPAQPPPAPIQPGAILWQRQVSAAGAPFTHSDFSGIVEAICPDTGQLLISADDIRESAHDLLFTVPAGIDTTELEVGQSVIATANIATDGSLTLTGLASDERTKGADDAKAAQGDLADGQAKTSIAGGGTNLGDRPEEAAKPPPQRVVAPNP